jgi:beta-galactosidase
VLHRFLLLLLTACAAYAAPTVPSGPAVTSIVPDGKPHRFEARAGQFWIDGQPTLLVAGEMHFGRVLPEDWELRLKQAKAMGLNTVSFYLFWNLCEPREGEFSFTGMTDVRRMLQLCQREGLWVVLRPGPYCCAEVEYGGIPWWTAKYPDVKIRSTDPKWLEWSRRYIRAVAEQVADLQVSRGGPLLMVQLDNEYGMISGGDFSYLHALTAIFREAGFDGQLFTCDPFLMPERTPGTFPAGVLRGRNGLRARDFERTRTILGDAPIFVPELYTAWFSGWGQPIARRHAPVAETVTWTNELLSRNVSFCYYMFFGGTTFGFFNGANEYLPVQTSYDYSAPVDEAGRTTEKYRALRTLLADRLKLQLPAVPPDPPVITVPAVTLSGPTDLLAQLPPTPTRVGPQPLTMEELDQDYGFVLYRKTFPDGLAGTLELKDARDYTLVMVNGRTVARAFVGNGLDSNRITLDEHGPVTLDLLVYNLGRISVITSSSSQNRARKGLAGAALLNGAELRDWQMYSLPLARVRAADLKPSSLPHGGPAFYHGTFDLNETGGTFLDLRAWSFGVVWVNGHNLGRFWDHGGLRSLFVPQHWLHKGANEIVVLELHDAPKNPVVSGGRQIIEEPAVPFRVRLDRPNLQSAAATEPGHKKM